MALSLKIITEPAELASLRADWSELWSTSGQGLHLCYAWFCAGWESFHAKDRLHVVTVVDTRLGCVGIAPLLITADVYRGVEVQKICFQRNDQSPCSDFILLRGMEDACLKKIFEYLDRFEQWDLVDLRKLEVDGIVWNHVVRTQPEQHRVLGHKSNIESPYIPIAGDWQDFWQSRPVRFRKSMRNKLNRAEKYEDLSFARTVITDDQAPELEEMLRVSGQSWKRSIGQDLVTRANNWMFYKKICAVLGRDGAITLWTLKKGDTVIAFEFHLCSSGVTCPIRADYDETFKALSPGSILEHHIIRTLFTEAQIGEYNSCGHTYNYLLNWTDRTRTYANVELFNRTAKMSGLYAMEYRVLPVLRKLKINDALYRLKQWRAL